MEKLDAKRESIKKKVDSVGNLLVETFHYLGLFLIGAVVFWAAFMEVHKVISEGAASIDNVLLLFIYLELGAMVGIYFKTNHLPIRFLIYVGITAMTRHLIGLITEHGSDNVLIISYCIGIFVLSLSVLVIRFASFKYPSSKDDKEKIIK